MIRSFETSFGRLDHKETAIVKLYDSDGRIGYGESSAFYAPLYNPETVDTCLYVQEKFLAPSVVSKEFTDAWEFRAAYKSIVGHKIAKAGIESAFWHLLAQQQNKSLKELFGGTRSEIPVGESIGIHPTIEATLEEIDLRLSEGYIRIKVKVKPNWDLKVVEAIRNKYPTIDLMVDGNSAYNLKEHKDTLLAFDRFNLTMIEQPLAEDDIIDHGTLAKLIKTPICMDESIESVDDARKAIQIGACKIINIKPGRVGGPAESLLIHDLAEKEKIGVWCGGMLETGIGRAFNIALASKNNFIYPADMSPSAIFYKEDIIEPTYVVKNNGHINVSIAPGLGYGIREDAIKRFTLSTITVK